MAVPLVSVTKLLEASLALSWFAILTTRRDASLDFLLGAPSRSPRPRPVPRLGDTEMGWAEAPGAALGSVGRYALNLVLFLIVFTVIRTERDLGRILIGFMLGAAFAVGYAFVAPSAEDAGRLRDRRPGPKRTRVGACLGGGAVGRGLRALPAQALGSASGRFHDSLLHRRDPADGVARGFDRARGGARVRDHRLWALATTDTDRGRRAGRSGLH